MNDYDKENINESIKIPKLNSKKTISSALSPINREVINKELFELKSADIKELRIDEINSLSPSALNNLKSFYLDKENQILFQKIRPFNRDLELEKQVHYYHKLNPSSDSFTLPSESRIGSTILDIQNSLEIKNCDTQCVSSILSIYCGKTSDPDGQSPKNGFIDENDSPFIKTLHELGDIEFINYSSK
ncbi:hypothetical protein AYI70_g789 [Smittium culicis]|uniref:Uncharacterized protein n=1 Tax=Smittium culicis TaxID=133412 RepID=A0A1R1XUU4_9FUNG|nr:hypothetical protein AYI70_g8512 [Smittium culicis]OMJ18433.1 hypothetical protein AYI70_g5357 [Smittium culicis]OMJ25621.1 hypothetical protein AYI70_g789 [Smittium culicis]